MTNVTEHQQKIFLDRYALKDDNGNPIETDVKQMWYRVANAVAKNEEEAHWRFAFYSLLENFKFVPAGRILTGAGTGHRVTYYNCYVIPSPEDSRGGIIDNIKLMTEIMARGGGVGVNMSTLRPKGSYIKTVNGHSSGPVAWMELYSVATGDVIQQGGSRRGALMLMLDDSHPDIFDFIKRKSRFITDEDGYSRPEFLEHANISVSISNEFMHAVENDLSWDLLWNGEVTRTVRARALFREICVRAHASADPGLVFMGRYREMSNSHYFEDIRCVNPCGEQGLGPYSVCNLGAMNLSAYVHDGNFDVVSFYDDVRIAVRFMDNVIDLNEYFLPENEQIQKRDIRRCGLGTMGLADALIKMGIRYGSPEAVTTTRHIFSTLQSAAYSASCHLANERGSFGKFDKEKYLSGKFIQTLPDYLQALIAEHGIRNCFLLTQAPTGTTSLLAGVSSGIEPVFAFTMKRRDRTGEHTLYHPLWREMMSNTDPIPDYFVRADQVSVEEHIAMQAAAQEFIDSSISKTINLPNSATIEDVERAYLLAWSSGLKGITVYRNGSRDAVLTHVEVEQTRPPCPVCGVELITEEGCSKCPDCGYSACEVKSGAH